MRVRLKWSSIASVAFVVSACSSPKAAGLFNPVSTDGDSGAGGDASSGESAGAGGAEDVNCGSGGVAGGGGSSGAATVGSGGVAGGGGSSGAAAAGAGGSLAGNGSGGATTTAGVCGGAGGSIAGANNGGAAGSIAGASNGGTAGGGGSGGNGTGGMLSKCELLLLQANAQLQGAQTCSTASGEAFCTGYATNECGCKVPVNKGESVATENYVKARDTFKNECSATCTTPCVEPKSQTCQLIFGLVVGSCVAM